MTLYDTARCYSMICILGTWHMMHCMVAGIEAIIELSSVTVDCRLLDIICQPPGHMDQSDLQAMMSA